MGETPSTSLGTLFFIAKTRLLGLCWKKGVRLAGLAGEYFQSFFYQSVKVLYYSVL